MEHFYRTQRRKLGVLVDAAGKPVNCTALVPREEAEILDDWYVMGLRGTRSEGYQIDDVFVEDGLTLDRDTPEERRLPDTLYKFSTTMVYAGCFSGVALGIARAMLDELLKLALHKTPRGTTPRSFQSCWRFSGARMIGMISPRC